MNRQLALRTRLTLAYTAIVAVAVLLLGTVAFVTVRFTLDTSRDTRLETTAKAIRSVVDVKDGALNLDMNDEIVKGTTLTKDGAIVHQPTLAALSGSNA